MHLKAVQVIIALEFILHFPSRLIGFRSVSILFADDIIRFLHVTMNNYTIYLTKITQDILRPLSINILNRIVLVFALNHVIYNTKSKDSVTRKHLQNYVICIH